MRIEFEYRVIEERNSSGVGVSPVTTASSTHSVEQIENDILKPLLQQPSFFPFRQNVSIVKQKLRRGFLRNIREVEVSLRHHAIVSFSLTS